MLKQMAVCVVLVVALSMPGHAGVAGEGSVLERLKRLAPSAIQLAETPGWPSAQSIYLRAVGQRMWAAVELDPDRMGPVGCGYHAMVDAAVYASETRVVRGVIKAGAALSGLVSEVSATVCPISALVGGGDREVGAERLRQMNLPVCQGVRQTREG